MFCQMSGASCLRDACFLSFRYHGSFGHVSSRKVYHIVAAGSRVGSKAVQAVKTLHCLFHALVFQSYLRPGGVLDLFLGSSHTSQRCLETYPVGMFKRKRPSNRKKLRSKYMRPNSQKRGGGSLLVVGQESYEFQGSTWELPQAWLNLMGNPRTAPPP